MTYQESVDWLFRQLPMYQRQGKAAFKKDLGNIRVLLQHLGHPENQFQAIHIAGSNGKGSVSHMLAAVSQKSGYKTGLYTSPHIQDFRERIKLNGQEVPPEFVVDFVKEMQKILKRIRPSFFEMTVAMAFKYFADSEVDLAVVETGLGGRLDSTNVLTPLLSAITNISLDHQDMLGPDIASIAFEKAGIIKTNVPVVIGRHHPESDPVFTRKAKEQNSPIYFPADQWAFQNINASLKKIALTAIHRSNDKKMELTLPSGAHYQLENLKTVLTALDILNARLPKITRESVQTGLAEFPSLTSFKGRWQILSDEGPLILSDAAHNAEGLKMLFNQVKELNYGNLYCIMGSVRGKNIDDFIKVLPGHARFIFVKPNVPRGLEADVLVKRALQRNLKAEASESVALALKEARSLARPEDLILIAGSIFILDEAEKAASI